MQVDPDVAGDVRGGEASVNAEPAEAPVEAEPADGEDEVAGGEAEEVRKYPDQILGCCFAEEGCASRVVELP